MAIELAENTFAETNPDDDPACLDIYHAYISELQLLGPLYQEAFGGLKKVLYEDVEPENITVNMLAPPYFESFSPGAALIENPLVSPATIERWAVYGASIILLGATNDVDDVHGEATPLVSSNEKYTDPTPRGRQLEAARALALAVKAGGANLQISEYAYDGSPFVNHDAVISEMRTRLPAYGEGWDDYATVLGELCEELDVVRSYDDLYEQAYTDATHTATINAAQKLVVGRWGRTPELEGRAMLVSKLERIADTYRVASEMEAPIDANTEEIRVSMQQIASSQLEELKEAVTLAQRALETLTRGQPLVPRVQLDTLPEFVSRLRWTTS